MDDILQQMGIRIYERRKQMRLTQEQLAERAGITAQTVSTAELGKKALRPENIVRLAIAMDVSTDYLLLGKCTPNNISFISETVSGLTSKQYRCLEEIVNNFILALKE